MVIAILALVVGFFLFLVCFVHLYLPFREERNYIKMEMARSFEEEEYLFWKRELKCLYLRSIPVIGRLFK